MQRSLMTVSLLAGVLLGAVGGLENAAASPTNKALNPEFHGAALSLSVNMHRNPKGVGFGY